MIELIKHYDQIAFYYINGLWHNDTADIIMPFMRKASNWIPLYFGLLVYIFWNYSKYFWKILLFLILTVSLSDSISSHLIKKTVKRPRPCNEVSMQKPALMLVHCGSGYSFTSSHAANHYALSAALSLSIFRRKKRWQAIFFTWAACIAYAQVYVGVHFPLDVLCGAILGIIIATLTYRIVFKKYEF